MTRRSTTSTKSKLMHSLREQHRGRAISRAPALHERQSIGAPGGTRALITVQATQLRLAVGHTKLYELLAKGDLTAKKIGRRTLVEVASIESFLERLPSAYIAPPKPTQGTRALLAAAAEAQQMPSPTAEPIPVPGDRAPRAK